MWQLMLETLGWRSDDSEQLLDLWKKVVETLQRSSIVSEPVATEPVNWWSAATSFTARAPLFSTPMCYGGHRVILLGNMRSLLRLNQHDPDAHTWVREVRCRVRKQRSLVVLGMHSRGGSTENTIARAEKNCYHRHCCYCC